MTNLPMTNPPMQPWLNCVPTWKPDFGNTTCEALWFWLEWHHYGTATFFPKTKKSLSTKGERKPLFTYAPFFLISDILLDYCQVQMKSCSDVITIDFDLNSPKPLWRISEQNPLSNKSSNEWEPWLFLKLYQEVGLKSENELFPRSKHSSQTLKMTFSLTFFFLIRSMDFTPGSGCITVSALWSRPWLHTDKLGTSSLISLLRVCNFGRSSTFPGATPKMSAALNPLLAWGGCITCHTHWITCRLKGSSFDQENKH